VEHLYVKFDDPSCISFQDIVWKNKQTNKQTDTPLKTRTTRLPSVWVITADTPQ